jgi:hypothetical protein
MNNGTLLDITLPATVEEQVTYLLATAEALGSHSYTAYDRVLDGFDAIGNDTRDSVSRLINAMGGKQGTEGESKILTARQMYWTAGLVAYVHLIGKLTAEEAYGKAVDALYKPGKNPALADLTLIIDAVTGETPVEALDALGSASRSKRDADAKLAALRSQAKVMSADKLFPELDKFVSVYGRDTVLAHMGITLVSE